MAQRKKVKIPDDMFSIETEEEEIQTQERLDHQKNVKDVKRARRARAEICREDVNEFCIFVGRDSETGRPIKQKEIHEEFQYLADMHKRLIVMSFPECGKSVQLGVLRSLWKLGLNPNLRICFVSKNADNATKNTRMMKEYIEKSEELAEVFPEMIPSAPWTDSAFTIRRPQIDRNPSVQAIGIDGSPTGSRIDILILDDVLDLDNTMSEAERKRVLRRIRGTFIDRLSKDGVVIFLTNAWHPEDAAHIFEDEAKKGMSNWKVARFPVYYENENGEKILAWEDKWDWERIEEARSDMGALEFARAHLCKARDDGESPFDSDAIENAIKIANEYEIDLVYSVRPEECAGFAIVHGVDLAIKKKKKNHRSAIVTILLDLETLHRQLLWVESGRWSSSEIRDRILDHDRRYGGLFVVENNAAQDWIIDIIYNQSDLPIEKRRLPAIVPFTTGKQKAHPEFGVEGIAAEFSRDLWIYPDTGPADAVSESMELKGEMLYYVRGTHTGDRLMALWFAREGCRRGNHAGKSEKTGRGNYAQSGGDMGQVKIIDGDYYDSPDEYDDGSELPTYRQDNRDSA
jgi:hypothetical protein